jgi:hypothetical protein
LVAPLEHGSTREIRAVILVRMAAEEQRHDSAASVSDAERRFLEAQIDAVLDAYRGSIPDGDLAFVRARLLEGAMGSEPALDVEGASGEEGAADRGLARLVRAAFPRDVDQSGEVAYRSGARRGGR